jgi:hypothetical protein
VKRLSIATDVFFARYGVITHGTVNKDDLAAALMEFLDQEDLMNVLASKPVGCRQENELEGSEEGMVAQPIETRTIQVGATVASSR